MKIPSDAPTLVEPTGDIPPVYPLAPYGWWLYYMYLPLHDSIGLIMKIPSDAPTLVEHPTGDIPPVYPLAP